MEMWEKLRTDLLHRSQVKMGEVIHTGTVIEIINMGKIAQGEGENRSKS